MRLFPVSRTLIAVFAAVLGLTACGDKPLSQNLQGLISSDKPAFQNTDITGIDYAKGFALTDHNGKPRTLADFKGKAVVVFFGYTQCPDVCPTTMAEMASVMQALGPLSDRVQVLFVTIDPERDTQALLAHYVPAFDSAWVKRLAAMLQVMRLALLLLAATLGVVVMAVIFNTVRLQVLTQREEIAVSRLIGATDAFIHRPFYYTGALLGICAGTVALAAVTLALQPLNGAIAEFARLYASEFRLTALDPLIMLMLLAISATLGLLGAAFSVRRHLARLP